MNIVELHDMNVNFAPIRVVSEIYDRPETGCFSLAGDPLVWVKCRETFAGTLSDQINGFYFSIDSDKAVPIAGFVSKTEDILDLGIRTVFAQTNRSYVIWMEPSPFWLACEMRRSLFTILLRAGGNYDIANNNYDETLYNDPQKFACITKPAVMRFLFGFTKFVPDDSYKRTNIQHRQWVDVFENKTYDDVRRYLVAEKPHEDCLVGRNSLWG